MEKKFIKDILELISGSDVAEIHVEKPDLKVVIKKNSAFEKATHHQERHYLLPGGVSRPQDTAPVDMDSQAARDKEHRIRGLVAIKSPIVGTFYSAPSPDADDYVAVGANVKKGQVLCIVEAMKLMNEIESDVDGKIVELMVENSQPVGYGDVLFLVEPQQA